MSTTTPTAPTYATTTTIPTPPMSPDSTAIPSAALQLSGDLALSDGTVAHVRPIRVDDVERLRAFHMRLSAESITYRFFRYLPELSRDEARKFTRIDYARQMALVATQGTGEDERIIGVVRYCGLSADTAEVAFVVADAWQGHGISTDLFHRLALYARAHGFKTFVALTMATNARMLGFFHHCGLPATFRYLDGEYEVHLDISA